MGMKICTVCGKEFSYTHNRVTMCSEACRNKSKRMIALRQLEKRKEKTRERLGTRICKVCGKEFQPKNPQMLMCSKDCNGNKNRLNANKRKLREKAKVQKAVVASKKKQKNAELVQETVLAKQDGLSYGKAKMNLYIERQSIEMAIRRRQLQEEWERRKKE